ncbi:hypothetical protein BHE74_00039689 [Ensete ventricosum]|nr:hypothetical protein BHE74_00039689 [Ensete ventricosum]RZS22355.1 hypothetical protein BHM03_00055118 [Ensete ventricosum]
MSSSGLSSSLPWSTISSSARVMDGASSAAAEAESRPEVVDRTDSSSLGVITPVDTKVFMALVVMRSCHDYDSTITVQRLAEECRCGSRIEA